MTSATNRTNLIKDLRIRALRTAFLIAIFSTILVRDFSATGPLFLKDLFEAGKSYLSEPICRYSVAFCLLAYFCAFSFLLWSKERKASSARLRQGDVMTLCLTSLAAILLCMDIGSSSLNRNNSDAILLIAAITISQTFAYLASRRYIQIIQEILIALGVVFTVGCFSQPDGWRLNPDKCGIFMAVGITILTTFLKEGRFRKESKSKWSRAIAGLLMVGLIGLFSARLLKSHSSIAWLALLAGFAFLFADFKAIWRDNLKRMVCLLAISLVGVVSVFYYSGPERNKMPETNWQAGLMAIAEKPLGFCLDGDVGEYIKQRYLATHVANDASVTINSYLGVSISYGLTAIGILVAMICVACRRGEIDNKKMDLYRNACRAAAIVLGAAFLFDGGLTAFSTATVFFSFLSFSSIPLNGSAIISRGTTEPKRKTFLHAILGSERSPLVVPFVKKSWNGWLKKWLIRGAIAFGILLLIPPIQVIYTRSYNPSITGPMLLRRIKSYVFELSLKKEQHRWRHLDDVPADFLACVWISEDNLFFKHSGFDWDAIQDALKEARETGRPARGASTISQQCARSIFLWHGRSWLRKGLEAYYTFWMETLLSKERILELYVNNIELGEGIYGVEAASQYYYGTPADQMSRRQSAMLVAIMPKPLDWSPRKPNERVKKRQQVILNRSENVRLPIKINSQKIK